MSAEDIAVVGVPVTPFPRWMRCRERLPGGPMQVFAVVFGDSVS